MLWLAGYYLAIIPSPAIQVYCGDYIFSLRCCYLVLRVAYIVLRILKPSAVYSLYTAFVEANGMVNIFQLADDR